METQAWQNSDFQYDPTVPSMISDEERKYLYWLCASAWSGDGCVVEIGPWLGGSTICLAAGMRDSGHATKSMLKVYDNFLWRLFMSTQVELPISPGDSFHPFFLVNTAAYAEIIDCHIQALPDEEIKNDKEASAKRFGSGEQIALFDGKIDSDIEILFIDGAKSWHGICYLMRSLCTQLIPGQTILVCQDFKYWGTYWVPLFMAHVWQFVEPIHNVINSTTMSFRLLQPIPTELINSFPDHISGLSRDDVLAEITNLSDWLKATGDLAGSQSLSLAKVSFLSHHGDTTLAIKLFRDIEKNWPASVPLAQLDRARTYLNEEKGANLPAPIRLRLAHLFQRVGKKTARFRFL